MTAIIIVILLKIYVGIGFVLFVTSKHDIEGKGDLAVAGYGTLYSFTWPFRKR